MENQSTAQNTPEMFGELLRDGQCEVSHFYRFLMMQLLIFNGIIVLFIDIIMIR